MNKSKFLRFIVERTNILLSKYDLSIIYPMLSISKITLATIKGYFLFVLFSIDKRIEPEQLLLYYQYLYV